MINNEGKRYKKKYINLVFITNRWPMAYIVEDNAYWDRKYNRNSNIMMDYHTSYNLCDSLMDLLNQNHDPN